MKTPGKTSKPTVKKAGGKQNDSGSGNKIKVDPDKTPTREVENVPVAKPGMKK